MRRSAAVSLGKMPTTLVRRLISLFRRSSGLFDQILRQCALSDPDEVNKRWDEVVDTLDERLPKAAASMPQLGDAELQVAGLGRQRLGSVATAFRHASLDAFITASADRLDGFGLDQLLKHPSGDLTDQVDALADADRVEKIRRVRIGQSHRCVLLDVVLAGTHQESRRWLTYRWTSKPTTSRGAVVPGARDGASGGAGGVVVGLVVGSGRD